MRNRPPSTERKLIASLQELVRIESVSGNEKKVADFIENRIHQMGLPEGRTNYQRFGNNLVLRYKTNPNLKSINLITHIDTVPLGDPDQWMSGHPLSGNVTDRKVYGRGTTDVKQGAAVFLNLMQKLKQQDPHYNLNFVFYDNEEKGSPNGINTLLEAGALSRDFSVVIEPTDGKIVYGCFGDLGFKIAAEGRAGHSSTPEAGENAILKMNEVINRIRSISLKVFKTMQGQKIEEVLAPTKQFDSGLSINSIPGSAETGFDFRFLPTQTVKAAQARIRALLRDIPGIRMAPIAADPGYVLKEKDIPKEIRTLSKEFEMPLTVVRFWSDIAQLGHAGIPSVNIGGGSIAQAHIVDEYLEIRELQKLYNILSSFIFKE